MSGSFRRKKAERSARSRNLLTWGPASVTSDFSNPVIELTLSPAECRENRVACSEHEEQVIALFDQLRAPLLRYALSIGLARADGEEIIQEAFLSLFQHLQQGRSRHNLRGWLFRVVHNLSLKRLSRNKRCGDVVGLDRSLAEFHLDSRPNPEEQASFSQRQTRLLAVLRALPAQDQHCLRLRAEGLRYREIAEVLGRSLGSISASLARSLARLGRADGR
jgi:RNA polymerase sigma-70 factor, ECF subfamily